MSRFIDDEQLREFVHDVMTGEPSGLRTAHRLYLSFKAHDAYLERAECSCRTNMCGCIVSTPTRPNEIEAGDTFEQIDQDGRRITLLGALGVRRNASGEISEIFTAGWPPMIVTLPRCGTVRLIAKGTSARPPSWGPVGLTFIPAIQGVRSPPGGS